MADIKDELEEMIDMHTENLSRDETQKTYIEFRSSGFPELAKDFDARIGILGIAWECYKRLTKEQQKQVTKIMNGE